MDRFNDEDLAEFGEEPQKGQDRGLLLDKIFNKLRMMPGNKGRIEPSYNQNPSMNIDSNYDIHADGSYGRGSSGGFNIKRGDDVITGLNYDTSNGRQWAGTGSGSNNIHFGGMPDGGVIFPQSFPQQEQDPNWIGPWAGPPMFIQPAPPASTTPSSGSSGTTIGTAGSSGDGVTASPGNGTGGSTTMPPHEKAAALVRAFGGGERARIQQMGPPILVPMGSVPGLRSLGRVNQKQNDVVLPGQQRPMYGKIVLGRPKFGQSVDMNNRFSTNSFNTNNGALTLVRFNKPSVGVNWNQKNNRDDQFGMGGSGQTQMGGGQRGRGGGFRSLEPYEEPAQRQRAPPIIKYVPVVEIVKRRRMKAVLADPI